MDLVSNGNNAGTDTKLSLQHVTSLTSIVDFRHARGLSGIYSQSVTYHSV